MPSSPLGNTNGLTTSGVDCQHHLWEAHMVERRRAWHAIIALGQHTRSNDVRRDMPSPPLDSTHDRTTLGMACHHHLWAAQMVEQCRAWHAIIDLERQTRSNDIRRDMPSPPLDSTHGRTSGLTCHHRHWTTHTVVRRRAWHAVIAIGQNTQSNDVRRDMPS